MTRVGPVTCCVLLLLSVMTIPPEPGGLSGAGESRLTQKLCCMPTDNPPPLNDVIAGWVTVTVADVTLGRTGAEMVMAYLPVPVGVPRVTDWTALVLLLPAGMVTWVGETVTMLDVAPVLGSI